MSLTPTSPVVGAAVTGLTNPTFTLTEDLAPSSNGRQWAVTALGGTQEGVTAHSASRPFYVSLFRPARLAVLPNANPITGKYPSVPKNRYKIRFAKGISPAADALSEVFDISLEMNVPAGSETYEPEDLAALVSLAGGFLSAEANQLVTMLRTNLI